MNIGPQPIRAPSTLDGGNLAIAESVHGWDLASYDGHARGGGCGIMIFATHGSGIGARVEPRAIAERLLLGALREQDSAIAAAAAADRARHLAGVAHAL